MARSLSTTIYFAERATENTTLDKFETAFPTYFLMVAWRKYPVRTLLATQ